MRFVAVVAVAFLLCAGGGVAQKVDIGSQLRSLDVTNPSQLKAFISAMHADFQKQLETERVEKVALQKRTKVVESELSEAQGEISWLKKDREAFQSKTRVMEAETVAVRAEVEQVKKEKEALENKTQLIEGELFKEKKQRMQLSIEVTEVRSALYRFSNKTNTDYTSITVRLRESPHNVPYRSRPYRM
eukprot:SAG31_NODE_13073_length_894_cov_3.772327_1_plen_188_part_00